MLVENIRELCYITCWLESSPRQIPATVAHYLQVIMSGASGYSMIIGTIGLA